MSDLAHFLFERHYHLSLAALIGCGCVGAWIQRRIDSARARKDRHPQSH